MNRFLKWAGIILGVLVVAGFIAFLYLIPPFTLVAPEEFSKAELNGPPALDGITDPAERLLAERGKYIVLTTGCAGCHTPQGSQGPNAEKYLAGGFKLVQHGAGEFFSRNLTPDGQTGLSRRSPDEVIRILRTGLNTEGRIIPGRLMPWPEFSHWTAEDRYAVMVYLRHIKPVHNNIPMPDIDPAIGDPTAVEQFFPGDYSIK